MTFEVGCTMAFDDDTISGRAFVNCAFIFIFFIPLCKYGNLVLVNIISNFFSEMLNKKFKKN